MHVYHESCSGAIFMIFSEKIMLLHVHCYTVSFAKEAVIWIYILGKVNFIHISKDCT